MIVSLVRSNAEHEVGFLAEKRRLNGEFHTDDSESEMFDHPKTDGSGLFLVAMTRPKRHLCVVGDSETVGR